MPCVVCRSAFTGCLAVFSIVFVSMTSIIRCGAVPLPALVQGLGASILFGLNVYYGQEIWPAGRLWNTVWPFISWSHHALAAKVTAAFALLKYDSLCQSLLLSSGSAPGCRAIMPRCNTWFKEQVLRACAQVHASLVMAIQPGVRGASHLKHACVK